MYRKWLIFYFAVEIFKFSLPQTIPCSTCSESNSIKCCDQLNRCCQDEIEGKGICPVFNGGRCTYKCIDDKYCAPNEKCCSQNTDFPRKVCILTQTGICPKSVSKSSNLNPCKIRKECSDDELCCNDPRNTGCCLKYVNDTSLKTTVTTPTTESSTPIETTSTTVATTTTTKTKPPYVDEWVPNE